MKVHARSLARGFRYARRMRGGQRFIAAVGCLLVGAVLSGCGAQSCGCGASPDEALAGHDLSYLGDHDLNFELNPECACRCGRDPQEPWPLTEDGGCDRVGVSCMDSDGARSELVCEG